MALNRTTRTRKTFLKSRQLPEQMNLQITSMADIFIIVLVFLLKSYASGAQELEVAKGIQLPQAQSKDQTVKALRIEVAENAILIEGRAVAHIQHYAFERSDIDESGASRSLKAAMARATDSAKLIVVADQRAPYASVRTVLASAAIQGYTDFKLAVVHAQ